MTDRVAQTLLREEGENFTGTLDEAVQHCKRAAADWGRGSERLDSILEYLLQEEDEDAASLFAFGEVGRGATELANAHLPHAGFVSQGQAPRRYVRNKGARLGLSRDRPFAAAASPFQDEPRRQYPARIRIKN